MPSDENLMDPFESVQPLFICLGVPKAATTWIHRQLEAHPQIGTTASKEINYWSSNYKNGPQWYSSQFPQDREYDLYAEVSVGYLREEVIKRLAAEVPTASFMVSLRNPYERSWSSYWQSVRTGRVRGTLEQALQTLPKIVDDSVYSPGLEAFRRVFSLERIHIALYDDLAADPDAFIQNIYSFAGVDSGFKPPELERPINKGRQHSIADQTLFRAQMIAKKVGLQRGHLVGLGLWSPVERIYSRLARKRPVPALTTEDWEVLDAYLMPELNNLEALLQRDLSFWRNRPREG